MHIYSPSELCLPWSSVLQPCRAQLYRGSILCQHLILPCSNFIKLRSCLPIALKALKGTKLPS